MADFVAPAPVDPDADPLAAFVGIDPDAEMPAIRPSPGCCPTPSATIRRLRPSSGASPSAGCASRSWRIRSSWAERSPVRATCWTFPPTRCGAWLGFLNDTRIALGSRLEITEDNHDELTRLPDDDPRVGLFQVYDWLTYLQDTLVHLLMP